MVGGGTDPHPSIPVRDTTRLSMLSGEAGVESVITSAGFRLRLLELVERFDFGRRECSVVDADFVNRPIKVPPDFAVAIIGSNI